MLARYYHVDVKKLERLLVERGWAASEIAVRAPFSQRTVDKILQGGRVFRSSLKRLADVFKVKPEELVLSGPIGGGDESQKATFNVNLSNVPADFDETSIHIHNFLSSLYSKVRDYGQVVDYVENGEKLTITIEIDKATLRDLFHALLSGGLKDIMPHGEPGDIPLGASLMHATLLWWADDIQFPDDCPFEPLRGKVVTKADRFALIPA